MIKQRIYFYLLLLLYNEKMGDSNPKRFGLKHQEVLVELQSFWIRSFNFQV